MMQLTKQTDFAFRVLIYLASITADETSHIQTIAERFAISKSHLMKIVQKLAQHGYIQSTRGHKGGLKLGKPANTITLKEIIELMETTLEPVNCQRPLCLINGCCLLKNHLAQAQAQYLSYLASITLADLINPTIQHQIMHQNIVALG